MRSLRLITITHAQGLVAAELLADGASNTEIAERLGLSVDTVKAHLHALLGAAECTSRTQFAVLVLRGALRLHALPRHNMKRPT